ncbi:MAG TPA: energy transducer TonB [Verrucomicrobiae bacterium]
MNAESAETQTLAEPKISGEGWSFQRWIFWIAFAFAAHVAFIFLFGAKKPAAPRAVTNVPQIHFVASGNELVALTDPTLFALPHAEDFTPAEWLRPPVVEQPEFRWTEPPPFLPPTTENLGASFHAFMQTNQFANLGLDFKPEPRLAAPVVKIESALPQNSSLQLYGELARRRMLNPISVPTLAWNDVIAPSRVQALVDADGNVVSVVLLESSEYEVADQKALELARAARFVPAAGLMFGELIFNWHTVPANTP